MRLSFIGYGSIAAAHVAAFNDLGGVEFDTVVGRNPETTREFAERWGFRRWSLDVAEALNDPCDGVVITSPSDMHAEQTLACLNAGRHVLAEIPCATNGADAEAVAEAARASDRVVQVAHTQRYAPALMELRRRVTSGELAPHHLDYRWFFLRRANVNWMGRQRSWTDNLLWHHGGHVVDAALFSLGVGAQSSGIPTNIRAQFGPTHPELGIPLDLDLQFRVENTLVSVAMSYNSHWTRHDYVMVGEQATLEFRENRLWSADGLVCEPDAGHNAIREQNREWLAAIREGRRAATHPDEIIPAMRVLAAAQAVLDAPA